jgi:polyhydroxyalkanoate synthesis regulator protein
LGIFKKTNTLTAAEVSALWLQYMGDSMAICVYKYFLNIVENKEIKPILEKSLQLSESHITKITDFLINANFQIPIGFTENDVNIHAPRLFSDQFLLFYSYIMTIHGLTAYSLAITNTERQDIQDYFFECTVSSKELFQKIVELAKNQPKYASVPSIPSPHGAKFIESPGFISNLIGDKRPLNSAEISTLFFNSTKTGFVRSLSLAFSQVAELEEVRDFMLKNVKLAGKDAKSFDDILQEDHLPIPEKWDAEITESTVSPFSDKLIMFHAGFLVNAALTYYGASIGSSFRSDIILNYSRVFTHAMEAGALSYNLMVKHGWLEKQPEAIDRKSLAQESEK